MIGYMRRHARLSYLAFWAVLACSVASPAKAQCVAEAQATPQSTCVVMARGDVRGVWFTLQEADNLRQAHLEVPQLQLQVQHLTQLADIQTSRMNQYRDAAQLRAETARQLEQQLNDSLRREAQVRASADSWYREPALWFTIGAIVATAVILAVIAGT